jgi:hypothetical protein
MSKTRVISCILSSSSCLKQELSLEQEMKRKKEAGENVDETELNIDVDVNSIEIPAVPLKNTLVQLYTG